MQDALKQPQDAGYGGTWGSQGLELQGSSVENSWFGASGFCCRGVTGDASSIASRVPAKSPNRNPANLKPNTERGILKD